MSRSKAKGTKAETDVVRFLQSVGFIHAERRTLNGAQDRGDIAGLPGVVIEVKNCARQELPGWVAEAERERDNDCATLGVVWHKRRGTTDPGRWFVTMSGEQFAALLREQQGLPDPKLAPRPFANDHRPCVACGDPMDCHIITDPDGLPRCAFCSCSDPVAKETAA